jgi:hypothetical protein
VDRIHPAVEPLFEAVGSANRKDDGFMDVSGAKSAASFVKSPFQKEVCDFSDL